MIQITLKVEFEGEPTLYQSMVMAFEPELTQVFPHAVNRLEQEVLAQLKMREEYEKARAQDDADFAEEGEQE